MNIGRTGRSYAPTLTLDQTEAAVWVGSLTMLVDQSVVGPRSGYWRGTNTKRESGSEP